MNYKAHEVSEIHSRMPSISTVNPAEMVSPAMRQIQALIERIAMTDRPVLILGPTGAGKEVVAQQLHKQSPRACRPFVDVNCSSIPESLMEAELFGHEKGAFTGAVSHRPGLFNQTDDGTLFLDEIGDLPLSMQPKLLRAIETNQYRRVGSGESHRFKGRIVAATHRDLLRMVREGSFRQDLYYRISVFSIQLPGLDQRREDIPLLAQHFASLQRRPLQFTSEALDRLARATWPGNIRQLKNVIDRIAVLTDNDCIDVSTIEPFLSEPTEALGQEFEKAVEHLLQIEVEDKMSAVEHLLVDKVLRDCQGNKTAAARILGVNRKVIERRVQAHANSLKKAAVLSKRAQSFLEVSNYDESSTALQGALSHLRPLPPSKEERILRFELLKQLAVCRRTQQGWLCSEVLDIYAETLRIGRGFVPSDELNSLMFGNWTAYLMRLELAKARVLAEEMRLRGSEANDIHLQIDGCIALANTRFWLGEYDGTLELVDEIVQLSNLHKASILRQGIDYVALVTMLEGLAAFQRGDSVRTRKAYQQLCDLTKHLTHAFSIAIALQGCAWIGCLLGFVADVETYGQQLLHVTQEHGFSFYRGVGQVLLGYNRSIQGWKSEAEEMMTLGFQQNMANQGGILFHSFYGLLLSRHYLAHGEPEKALVQAKKALQTAVEHRELAYLPELLCTHGRALMATGDFTAAEDEIRSAVSTAVAIGNIPATLEASELLACFLNPSGHPGQPIVHQVLEELPTSDCA